MKYDFDKIISRKNTDCVKYDYRKGYFGTKDVLPMWVADMDFETPDFITNALRNRTEHPIFGYSIKPDAYYETQVNWMRKRHQWEIRKEWIVFCPGIVPALNLCVTAFTRPGDKIIVQPPVYFPFFSAIKNNRRIQVDNPLKLRDGRYYFDLDDLIKKVDPKVKMIFLCNPQNPGGSVWTPEELTELAGICIKNNILIVSDEIHSDLILKSFRHTPTASLSNEIAEHVITCMAPSKTFNLAGLATSSVFISNKRLRNIFNRSIESVHIGMGNIFGIIASEAAYVHGEEWLSKLLDYINRNVELVTEYCRNHIPNIKPMKPEATYLVWLDCRDMGLDKKGLKKFMIEKARVGFNDGPTFGHGGEGFQRMNVGCPRSLVREALHRIEKAANNLVPDQ